MRTLAQRLLHDIRERGLLKAGTRLGVAVSGGLDSVALLRLLLELRSELGVVLSAVHFNHKLRGEESEKDEQFVAGLAREYGVEFHRGHGEVREYANERGLSVEAAARKLRYEFFGRVLHDAGLDSIATAHTLDDQAETILLRMARGAGTRGLAGIYPRLGVRVAENQSVVPPGLPHLPCPASQGLRPGLSWDAPSELDSESYVPSVSSELARFQPPAFSFQSETKSIIRPLLGVRRIELTAYLAEIKQDWQEDSSNQSLDHARNRVRHELLPWLERNLNPAVRERLAETAEIARAEEEYWQARVEEALPLVWDPAGASLRIAELAKLPLAMRRRVLRAACESLGLRLDFQHVEAVLRVACGEAKAAVLAAGWEAARERGVLHIRLAESDVHPDYEYVLSVPGRVEVREASVVFEAVMVPEPADGQETLVDSGALAKELQVRNWRAGDRFWPEHRKSPRKIKELLQERHIMGPSRKSWPVIVSGESVIWMRGFGVSQAHRLRGENKRGLVIREIELV